MEIRFASGVCEDPTADDAPLWQRSGLWPAEHTYRSGRRFGVKTDPEDGGELIPGRLPEEGPGHDG